MSKKVIIIISLAILAAVVFAACERSASKTTLGTPTAAKTGNASPQPTGMSLVQQWGTSTAVYEQTAVAMGLITAVPTTGSTQSTLNTTPLVPPTGVPTATPMPGTTPVVVVPTATPGRPASYTLQQGEFAYCIARRFNLNPDDLLSLNGLSQGQVLMPGLVLHIPATGSYPGNRALNSHPAQYTVAVGDTIYGIACHFGDIDPTAIAAANGLNLSSPLITGKVLSIP